MATTSQDATLSQVIPETPVIAGNEGRTQYSEREKLFTMIAVLLVMLLASLDQTIVDTAMPHIISDLQGFSLYTWVTTGYLLTSTVMVPVYGKLSDLFGRKPIFLIGVVLFLVGSAASGAAQTMLQLVLFRGFQGLGAAALLPIAMAVIGDLFTPRERARWQGIAGGVFGLSSVIGPTLGGFITDHSTWRWVFYVNLPVGVVALLVLVFLMPTLRSARTGKAIIDYLGVMFLIATTVPLLLALTWGGNAQYNWNSVQVIGMFVASAVFLVIFIFYERYRERRDLQPIIDLSMFSNRVFTTSVIITMITGAGMFGCIVFLPLFAQGVLGMSATDSGLRLLPMMIGLILSSVISGQLLARTGRYKWLAFMGTLITIGGTALMLRLGLNSTPLDLIIAMVVLGLGLGFGMSIYTVIVQNALPDKIGQATAGLTFFRSIGGTVATAILGAVLNASYLPAFHSALPASLKALLKPQVISAFDNPDLLLSSSSQEALQQQLARFGGQGEVMYQQLLQAVKVGLTDGIHQVFIVSTIIVACAFVAVFFLKEIPLNNNGRDDAPVEAIEEAVGESIDYTPLTDRPEAVSSPAGVLVFETAVQNLMGDSVAPSNLFSV
jgi:EmrB/QacA subfamily drug resistance transporter